MKVNVAQPLVSFNGKPVTGEGEDGKPRTLLLRDAICMGLMTPLRDETVEGNEKVRRHLLAQRVFIENEPDLPVDDIALCKRLIDKVYAGAAIVGPAWLLLDPPAPKASPA